MAKRYSGDVTVNVKWTDRGLPVGKPAFWDVQLVTPVGKWKAELFPAPGYGHVVKSTPTMYDAVTQMALDRAHTEGFPVVEYAARDGWTWRIHR